MAAQNECGRPDRAEVRRRERLRALVGPPPVAEPPSITLSVNRDQNDPMAAHDPGIDIVQNTERGRQKTTMDGAGGCGA